MSEITDESNAIFVRELRDSIPKVDMVAAWLRSRGHKLRVNPISIRPSIEQWREYSDSGDIILLDPERRVEVCHRRLQFTCRADYPLDALYIEKVRKYERRNPEPYAFIVLNKPMTHVAIVMCSTRPQWIVQTWRDDALNGEEFPVYACPVEQLMFARFKPPPMLAPRVSIFADNEFGF